MSDSFTTLWTKDRCALLRQFNLVGTTFDTLFGGPHTSEPGFRRAGVKTGDYIYPVWVNKGILYILTRMQVKTILPLAEYIQSFPGVFAGCERSAWDSFTFENYLKLHPEKRIFAPSCTDEVILGEDSLPIRLDVAVPAAMLEQIRFRSQKRERGLRHIVDGRLKSVIGLHGIYRLSPPSAGRFAELLAGPGAIR
ncbi:hypothetical protein LARV_00457 [Longilinea arvoryzae]|uniref:Uncharacterized protein n=1 Tax=Longilinea arvoryzae TaxID=360412 RepID=A0A0S7BG13_9CHLR|nr:hypothetical protein [Longilinea arvoryzae]GAP12721.1 hypothetical protein LARV_00457 [Longilinea arvoryzae]